MDLLISSEIFKLYFLERSSFKKTEVGRSVLEIFDNPNNKFVLSKKFLDIIEKEILKEDKTEPIFKAFITHILTEKLINTSSTINNECNEFYIELDQGYKSLPKNSRSNLYLFITNSESFSINPNKDVILKNVNKPNYHWICLHLASKNPQSITFRYFDFKNNNEIYSLFKTFFNIPPYIPEVDIFDRQCNLNHCCFDQIKHGYLVNYYTKIIKNGLERIDRNKSLRLNFKKLRIHEASAIHIHERRIKIKSLILETDDDFWNLEINRTTWKIDIIYCEITSKEIDNKKRHFKLTLT